MNRIRELRNERNLRQADLGKIIRVQPSTISNWENEKTEPDYESLVAMAELFDVTTDYLLGVDDSPEKKKAPSVSDEAYKLAEDYDVLDVHGQQLLRVVADNELRRVNAGQPAAPIARNKVIPLLGDRFAAGAGLPDLNVPWEDYEVPEESRAEFAVHIVGDSLEPHLHDGDIGLALKRVPDVGEVGAFLVDGDFLCKQVVEDAFGNLYLLAVNRKRKDTDRTLLASQADEHQLICFGTLILPRIPLPKI